MRCVWLLMLLVVVVCLTAETASFDIEHIGEHIDQIWQRFKDRHGKKYDNREEKTRRETFRNRIQLIIEHNLEAELGDHQFTLGLNEFADWTREEYKKYLTGYRNENDEPTEDESGPTPSLLTASPSSLPSSVDWVSRGWVTPVKNQGQCGCCYTFSATGALEAQLFNKTQKLVSLSEQNLVDCSTAQGNMGCNGGVTDWAFKYVKQNGGINTQASYPFTGKQGSCQYKSANSAATCSSWVDIPRGNEAALQQAVAAAGPVAVAIDASSTWFQMYRSGVYSSTSCSSTNLDHAVLVVGYGVTSSNEEYWLVKNSWGDRWGDKGYIKMARNKNNMCGIATQASYPIM